MVHSGCFLERQYCEFTGTVRGQNSREFVARLVARGFARAIEPGPVRRGRLYHVHHKPLYEAIGQADNRNRRLRTIGRMVERVMILDAVLGDRRCWWLSPEGDKRAFFDITQQTGLRPEDYPHIAFGAAPRKTDPLLPRQAAHRHREGRHQPVRVPLPREPARAGGLPPVPHSSPRPVRDASITGRSDCSCRGASGRPWRSTRRRVREELWTPLNPSVSKSLETYFRERQEQGGHLGDPSDRYIAQEFRKQGMPKIQALYRAWRRAGDKVLWQSSSTCLRDDWSYGRSAVRSPVAEPPVSPAHRLDGPGCVGQEGGEAKIASGWPPGFDTLSGRSLTPGGSMNAHCVQASVSQHLAASRRPRRRSVPPSPSVSVSQSVNQRWRERPRCPARRVTPGRRDGVVHAIVGRAACRCLRAQVVQDERAARVHVFVSRFAGTNAARRIAQKSGRARPTLFHGRLASAGVQIQVVAPSRSRCWRRAQRRQCSSLRFDPAGGRAFGH